MKTVVQRVRHASVTIDEQCVASIGQGMLLLVGFEDADEPNDLEWTAQKVANLRIFDDADIVRFCKGAYFFHAAHVSGDVYRHDRFYSLSVF